MAIFTTPVHVPLTNDPKVQSGGSTYVYLNRFDRRVHHCEAPSTTAERARKDLREIESFCFCWREPRRPATQTENKREIKKDEGNGIFLSSGPECLSVKGRLRSKNNSRFGSAYLKVAVPFFILLINQPGRTADPRATNRRPASIVPKRTTTQQKSNNNRFLKNSVYFSSICCCFCAFETSRISYCCCRCCCSIQTWYHTK